MNAGDCQRPGVGMRTEALPVHHQFASGLPRPETIRWGAGNAAAMCSIKGTARR